MDYSRKISEPIIVPATLMKGKGNRVFVWPAAAFDDTFLLLCV